MHLATTSQTIVFFYLSDCKVLLLDRESEIATIVGPADEADQAFKNIYKGIGIEPGEKVPTIEMMLLGKQ